MKVRVVGGCLRRGEVVTITLGDTRGGSPGLRMQTFCEDALELRFLVDVCATGHFVELPQSLSLPVVPGPAARNARTLASTSLTLPLHPELLDEEVDRRLIICRGC